MFLSVFDVFKIGIGPSSSHTMGPMLAARRFLDELTGYDFPIRPARVSATLHGSLAFTGRGHATDRAICLGLLGHTPADLDIVSAELQLAALRDEKRLPKQAGLHLAFDPATDIVFDYGPSLPGHSNGMVFRAFAKNGAELMQETYYSIGGGFVVTAEELEATRGASADTGTNSIPYGFTSANEMLKMGCKCGLSIAAMQRANEQTGLGTDELDNRLDAIWHAMDACIMRGISTDGILPGGLSVLRRAPAMSRKLEQGRTDNNKPPHAELDWLMAYALAVNEENASGGRVVTAPTNGAAGVIPAVLKYYVCHCTGPTECGIRDYLLTAAAIGGIIKRNASISGAELGCQGEVGSASAMAAAGLCAVFGGTNAQIENAAEIALEHHLGLTCDPVAGLVQVPCIERNGLGAAKAVAACSLAMQGDGAHFMPLDNCIAAMRSTGLDMNEKYKETSRGGLAVNLPAC